MRSLTKELDRVGGGSPATSTHRVITTSSTGIQASGPQEADVHAAPARRDRITGGPVAGAERITAAAGAAAGQDHPRGQQQDAESQTRVKEVHVQV